MNRKTKWFQFIISIYVPTPIRPLTNTGNVEKKKKKRYFANPTLLEYILLFSLRIFRLYDPSGSITASSIITVDLNPTNIFFKSNIANLSLRCAVPICHVAIFGFALLDTPANCSMSLTRAEIFQTLQYSFRYMLWGEQPLLLPAQVKAGSRKRCVTLDP